MKRALKYTILLLCAFLLIHEVAIISDGLMDDHSPKANVAVVFGTTVKPDGSLSDRLKARLDRGLELNTDAVVTELFVSGGLGKEGHLEGTVMAAYLVSQGVPENRITIDNEGINTRNTAVNFRAAYPGETAAVVVSQYFHVSRCKLAFRQVGVTGVTGVSPDHFELRDVYSTLREFPGYYKYWMYY